MKPDKILKNIPAEEFRKPMLITHYSADYTVTWAQTTINIWPLCPRCEGTTVCDYQAYCTLCGQRLKWNYRRMKNIDPDFYYVCDTDNDYIECIGTREECKVYIKELTAEDIDVSSYIIRKG
jgi:hypothetical protein